MRRYLLDSSVLAGYLNGRPSAVRLVSPWIANQEAATSVVVYGEVVEYIRGLPNFPQRHATLIDLLSAVHVFHATMTIFDRYAQIRRALRPPHGPGLIGDMDTLIAATALHRNLTLVTTDSDFERVPGLKMMVVSLPRDT
jgi:predicted nucleic acid-binding protein